LDHRHSPAARRVLCRNAHGAPPGERQRGDRSGDGGQGKRGRVHHAARRSHHLRGRRGCAALRHGSVHSGVPQLRGSFMPRTRSLAWSELRIGVLTISAIVIAALLIFSLTGTRGFFWQRYSLKTKFPDVAGLTPGSPVRVAGVEVGTVKTV